MKSGRYWQVNDTGILVNDAIDSDISHVYQPIIEAIVAAYTTHIAQDIHSIYLMGSVARGLAEPQKSDINVVAILEETVDPELVMQDWIEPAEAALLAQFGDVITDVVLDMWPYYYVIRDPEEFSVAAFLLQTQAVCIWGSDIAPDLPVYRFSDPVIRTAIANEDIIALNDELEYIVETLEFAQNMRAVQIMARYASKQLIYTTFSLLYPAYPQYSRDVDVCHAAAITAFPHHKAQLDRLLNWVDSPPRDAVFAVQLIEDVSVWLVPACNAWLEKYNPEMDDFFIIAPDPE